MARLSDLRKSRDPFKMTGAVEALQEAAACGENVMPYLIEAVKAKATLGEICGALHGSVWNIQGAGGVVREKCALPSKATISVHKLMTLDLMTLVIDEARSV